jgi:hypothetical protein
MNTGNPGGGDNGFALQMESLSAMYEDTKTDKKPVQPQSPQLKKLICPPTPSLMIAT